MIPCAPLLALPTWPSPFMTGAWKREAEGDQPIKVAIGVHYGEAVVGNIGDDRKLEYTVLGDTVNVASRLEHFTREVGATVVISEDLLVAVKSLGVDPFEIAPNLQKAGLHQVRGRQEPVMIWTINAHDDCENAAVNR